MLYPTAMGKHRRLAEDVNVAISTFDHLVTGTVPDSLDALTKARVVLVQNVNAYISYFGTKVRPNPATESEVRWKQAYTQVFELRRNYSEHITRFGSATIRTEWPLYQASCQTLVNAMRDHIRRVSAWDPID
ncbi:MAG: hypothetical protein PGN21_08375 [Sphingomonas paucimobilis]